MNKKLYEIKFIAYFSKHKKVYTSIFVLVFFVLFTLKYLYSSIYGVPPGFTGAPLDGITCATMGCHRGPVTAVQGWIVTDIPASGYIPGDTYNIALTASRPSTQLFGFLMTSHGIYGTEGAFIITDSAGTQHSQGTDCITHRPAGVTGNNSKTWHAQWVAPADILTTRIDFYAATVAGAFDMGDEVFITSQPAVSAFSTIKEVAKNHYGIALWQFFSEQVNITSPYPLNGMINIELYNAGGAFLKRWSHESFADRHISLATQPLAPGMYYFIITFENKPLVVKMIKSLS